MAILNNNPLVGASGNQGGYNINNSLRFRSSATAYLSRTFSSTGTNNKIQTFSAWVKRGLLSSSANYRLMGGYNGSANFSTEINFVNDNLRVEFGGSVQYELKTTQVFRDPSAWYHIVVAIDTTQATSSNRVKMYVNGSQITAFAIANYPAQNDGSQLTSANANNKLGASWSNAEPFDGYMADINFIDGSAKTPSDFGETDTTTGVWKPKAYTGTYGTNGFYLKFSDIATTSGSNAGLGKDFSGNSNYWTTNNISVTSGTTYDAMTDSPTNTSATVANYAVLNPVAYYGGYNVLSQGNLQFTSGNTNWMRAVATFAVSSGKWYWEITANNSLSQMHGILTATTTTYYSGATNWVGYDSTGYGYFSDNGQKWNNNAGATYGSTFGAGDIIGVAFDADNGTLTFYKNNVSQGTAFTGLTSGPYVPAVSVATTSGANTCSANFGQRPFSYTPPTGYVALNTYNLPTPTILQGNKYMDATLYTGDGASTKTISGLNFQPDFLWIKRRDNASDHNLQDAVRGFSSSTKLATSSTYAENTLDGLYTDPKWGYVSATSSTGFTVTKSTNGDHVNFNASPYVAWAWDANGSGSTNTAGSITSTVSVNATAGFSIVTYTGTGANATVGHGLGVAPRMIIFKQRNAVRGWIVYHASLANASTVIYLNVTNAASTDTTAFNATAPTSSVFSVGTSADTNQSTGTYVAYCWAEIAGFSKFTSYTGNGSTDGPFIFTNFRPKFIMLKRTDSTGSWSMYDATRNTYNAGSFPLFANLSDAESASTDHFDWLSNGFKMKSTNQNASGGTYIVMAFSSNPFKNSNAV